MLEMLIQNKNGINGKCRRECKRTIEIKCMEKGLHMESSHMCLQV